MKRSLHMMLCALLLFGCASEPPVQPPPPPPTIVELQIDAGTDVNADSNGKGAPVMLRIYELREQSNFKSSDFFALFNNDKETLAADLVRKQELLFQPGESKKITLNPDAEVSSLGVFAAFRALDTAQWRAVAVVQAHQTQKINVSLKNNQLAVDLLP